MKRIISLFLAALMLICVPAMAPAAKGAGKKLIAITYDDGPGPYTGSLLDGLKTRGVKATFFMLGNRVGGYGPTLARMYREGHQLANHSYDHSDLSRLTESGVRSQVQATNRLLDRTCGAGTDYMVRAPYGSVNSAVSRGAGAPLVFWSVDPQDWLYRNAAAVKNNIIRSAHDGAIILVHDIHSTSIPGSLAAIDYLKGQGYEFVTVRELFRRRGKAMSSGVQYSSCPSTGSDAGPVQAPVITGETENGRLRVTIKAQPGAAIYYTTGTEDLNQGSARYNGPFLTDYPCKVRAVAAFNMNGSKSGEAGEAFTMPRAESPRLSVSDGVLAIECDTPGAEVYYRLGTDETGWQLYTGPMSIEPGTEIAAYSSCGGYLDSGQAKASFSERGIFFLDVSPGQWYYEAMDRAAYAGYIVGGGDGMFTPGRNITRAELVTLLYRYSGEEAGDTEIPAAPFGDVPPDKYYAAPIAWAYERGLISGCGDGLFHPGQGISRQETAVIFYNFLKYRQLAPQSPGTGVQGYDDRDRIASWAREAVDCMSVTGLLMGNGKNEFQPAGNTTRAQAAAVLIRLEDYIGAIDNQVI